MWRRRDQPNTRRRMSHLGDRWIDLVTGKLSSLTRLSSLGHLDLQLFRVDQVVTRNPKTARSNLLDSAVSRVAIFIDDVASRIFATFTGIALATNAVHRDRQSFVRF